MAESHLPVHPKLCGVLSPGVIVICGMTESRPAASSRISGLPWLPLPQMPHFTALVGDSYERCISYHFNAQAKHPITVLDTLRYWKPIASPLGRMPLTNGH